MQNGTDLSSEGALYHRKQTTPPSLAPKERHINVRCVKKMGLYAHKIFIYRLFSTTGGTNKPLTHPAYIAPSELNLVWVAHFLWYNAPSELSSVKNCPPLNPWWGCGTNQNSLSQCHSASSLFSQCCALLQYNQTIKATLFEKGRFAWWNWAYYGNSKAF